MNLINYMITFTTETVFKGFIPLREEKFGVKIEDKCYAAIHLFRKPYTKMRSDDEKIEQNYLDKGFTTLVVIYGSDNTSYMKRFLDKSSAETWIRDTTELVRDDSWLWYNS